jgi:cbb3-type cytochrome oxidase maturation protein
MTAALVMILGAALLLCAVGIGAFVWALRHGQYEDPAGDAMRILIDDDP